MAVWKIRSERTNKMKYIKPEIVKSTIATQAILGSSVKDGSEPDGVQINLSATPGYEADE
jgi:hypothetical protein